MDIEKKTKKIICGEYLIFAIVAAVLSALILTRVWILGQSGFRYVFIYFTLALGAWFVIDLFWTIFSKKRRAKNSLLDKILPLPAPATVVTVDIISLIIGLEASKDIHQVAVGIIFGYLSLVFLFFAFYRYKHPSPLMLEAIEEAKKEEAASKIELPAEESPKQEEEQK